MTEPKSEERIFLHDISSPLTTALLNLDNALAMMEDAKPEEREDCLRLVEKSKEQISRVTAMIQSRREMIKRAP